MFLKDKDKRNQPETFVGVVVAVAVAAAVVVVVVVVVLLLCSIQGLYDTTHTIAQRFMWSKYLQLTFTSGSEFSIFIEGNMTANYWYVEFKKKQNKTKSIWSWTK